MDKYSEINKINTEAYFTLKCMNLILIFFLIICYYIQFDYCQNRITQSSSYSFLVANLLKHIGKKDDNVFEATRHALRL